MSDEDGQGSMALAFWHDARRIANGIAKRVEARLPSQIS
jgi:hypothetical protein